MGMSLGLAPLFVMLARKERSQLLGSSPKTNMEALNTNLEALVESLRPSEEERARQEQAFNQVRPLFFSTSADLHLMSLIWEGLRIGVNLPGLLLVLRAIKVYTTYYASMFFC